MARLNRPTKESTNPAKSFLEWKSDEKCFSFYNKDTKENQRVKSPMKLLFLEHYHGVKGWNDNQQSGIWSNEVFLISEEELEVKTKKGVIAKGLYKDIKSNVNNAGGVYLRVIYFMTENGEIIRVGLKGASVGGIKKEKSKSGKDEKGYSDFYNENNHLMDNQWIIWTGAHEAKSGKVEYSIPSFEMGETITAKENELAEIAVRKLQDFIDGKTNKTKEETEEVLTDNLDF